MKRKIRLNESQLHNIIRENIKSVINEELNPENDIFYAFYSEIVRKMNRIQTSLDNIKKDLRKFWRNPPEPIDVDTIITLQNYCDEIEQYQILLDNMCDKVYDALNDSRKKSFYPTNP